MDSDHWYGILLAMIASIPPTVAAWAALRRTEEDIVETKGTRRDLNGRLSELIETKARASYLAGYLAGVRGEAPDDSAPQLGGDDDDERPTVADSHT